MEHVNKMKAVVVAIAAALNGWLGLLAIPVYLLVALNIADYTTGVCAAKYRGETVNSYKGFRGIAKKVCMWLLVGLGVAVDWLLKYATDAIGVTVPVAFLVASATALWLIANEIISILENINDIGTELPPFLLPLMKKLKSTTEEQAGQEVNLNEGAEQNEKNLD